MTDTATAFVTSLRNFGATEDEIAELSETTDFSDVVDEDALAHERLASLRRVPSVAATGRDS